MKYVTGLFVTAVTLLGSMQVQAADAVLFQCVLEDDMSVMVERNSETDVFTLTYGHNLNAPTLTIRKAGNDLGTSTQLSHEEGTLNRDLYVTDGDKLYDVGFMDVRGKSFGSFQIMNAGIEESYQSCKRGTLHSKFDDYELFSNLTTVD